jgi:predicted amidohydrolase YtcJ
MTTERDVPDLILHSGLFTTLDRSNPTASAVAVKNGVFSAVGRTEEIRRQTSGLSSPIIVGSSSETVG